MVPRKHTRFDQIVRKLPSDQVGVGPPIFGKGDPRLTFQEKEIEAVAYLARAATAALEPGLLYQGMQIIEVNDISVNESDPRQVQLLCYLEDGSSRWLCSEWIDQTKRGELYKHLQKHHGGHDG